MVRQLVFLCLIIFISKTTIGQDIHFTQFYMQPLALNPALAGDFVGDSRGAAIYRRQWGQLGIPIVTSGLSYEKKIRISQDFICVGGQLLNDRVKEIGLNTTKAYVGAAYMKYWKKSLWHVGFQFGFIDHSYDHTSQTFPTQYNGNSGGFDLAMAHGESGLTGRSQYYDIALGLLWVKKIKKKYLSKTGISIYHLNGPKHSFLGEDNQLPMKYVLHHESQFWLNSNLTLIPKVQAMRLQNATDVILITLLKRRVNKETAMYIGGGYRGYGVQSDALILTIGGEFGYIDVGVSMDWNVSKLSENAGRKSTIEWSAIVRSPPKKYMRGKHKRKMPCVKLPKWE